MITCDEAREMLELSFGLEALPAELLTHMQECESCAALHAELFDLATGLGDDTDTVFSSSELERMALAVDAKIQPSTVVPIGARRWMQPMTRVAAAIVLVAASLITYQMGRNTNVIDNPTASVESGYEYGDLSSLWTADLEQSVDENVISILIDDYARDSHWGAGDDLVGDITDEEYQYLMENFEVGELL